jgi:DNA replication and repair protein RecF
MITYVRLQQFRSYKDGSFEFNPGVNIIVGPNASGKTTIIEAVLVALQGKSFKARDAELLQQSAEWARIDLGTEDTSRICKLVTEYEKIIKTFEIAGQVYKRLPAAKTIPVVLFEPNHLLLLHGSPDLRRTYLDDLIGQLLPGFESTRRHYKRVLSQRNALLKLHTAPASDQLFVWNLRLSELAGKIVSERQTLIARFNSVISQLYSEISGKKSEILLEYSTLVPAAQYQTKLLQKLEHSFARDSALGFTSHGPHREDVYISINGQSAAQAASRGEIRTLLLSLKMLEAGFVEEARKLRPVLLLDDVFSELDGKRRQALVSFLKPYQSLITTTDADVVIEHFTNQANVIPLSA